MIPTSIRFSEAERELIAAHQARLQDRTGKYHSATDVVRLLLREAKPPSTQSPADARLRRAYKAVFG